MTRYDMERSVSQLRVGDSIYLRGEWRKVTKVQHKGTQVLVTIDNMATLRCLTWYKFNVVRFKEAKR